MIPLQLPGGPELLVILLLFLVPLALLVVLVAGAVYLLRRRTDRIDELEARVEELESDRSTRE